jgi:hypothetical protein
MLSWVTPHSGLRNPCPFSTSPSKTQWSGIPTHLPLVLGSKIEKAMSALAFYLLRDDTEFEIDPEGRALGVFLVIFTLDYLEVNLKIPARDGRKSGGGSNKSGRALRRFEAGLIRSGGDLIKSSGEPFRFEGDLMKSARDSF